MFIECTKKLSEAMKIELLPYNDTEADSFYDWHANLFMLYRRKGVLLMNNKTRYCIVLYGLKMEHFKKFDSIVLDAIRETFLVEGLAEEAVEAYIEDCGQVKYTKTHDRSVLGQMKEFDICISWEIEDHILRNTINLVSLNRWIGRNLMCGTLDYAHPIDLLRTEFEDVFGGLNYL